MTRVLIVDDHDLIREGLRRAFEREDDLEVVGAASTVAEAVAAAAGLRPDVVTLDVRLPDGTGLDAARQIRKLLPEAGIVVLTMYAGDEQLFAALEAGASAFVAKSAPAEDVIAAVRHAASVPLSFSAADLGPAMRRRANSTAISLTTREAEVLDLLKDGLAIPALARRLYISESTAKAHVSRLYEKLGAANRAQALMTAVQQGLITIPDK
jgi:DNA-binding NarL/FixJ family response regulator